ncbi:MAG: hypothetical protein KY397_03550 [Gemmatimonadetes bacterium]|nr:hypothetical protein [Gemmatimonadota bacterium]
MSALDPGELAGALAELVVEIESVDVETGPVEVGGYYDGGARPKGVARLHGGEGVGRGECVAWSSEGQADFARACRLLVPLGRITVGGLERRLRHATEDPYHRAAIEAAAIDLALVQALTNPFALANRTPRPVSFCRSINRTDDPVTAMRNLLAADPAARIKIDCPEEGWNDGVWDALAETDRVAVVDFKRKGPPERPVEVHRRLPRAWLEDPPVEAAGRLVDPAAGDWGARIALDGYVGRASDLDRPALPAAAVNVKAPRVGGWLEALRCLETCRLRGWHAYVGGMFEVDVGRAQAAVLASLFTADAWNDLAPLGAPGSTSPIVLTDDYAGFAPETRTGQPS